MEKISNISDHIVTFYTTQGDLRTSRWFLMESPLPVFTATLIYVLMAKFLVPRYMEKRKAFEIENWLKAYNIYHLCTNIVFFYYAMTLGWMTTYSWRCEPVDRSPEGIPLKGAETCWWFLVFKLTDSFETMILLLGKRNDLTPKYHIAHHFMVPNMVWFVVKYAPGGHGTFFGFLNSLCHVFLYAHLVAVQNFPKLRQRLVYMKKLRKVLSVSEILINVLHTSQLLYKNDCGYPIEFAYYGFSFGFLFLPFSLEWYHSKDRTFSSKQRTH